MAEAGAEAVAEAAAFHERPESERAPEAPGHPWRPPARAIVSAAAAEPAVTPAPTSRAQHADVTRVFVELNSGESRLSKQQLLCVLILWRAESALWHAAQRPVPPAASRCSQDVFVELGPLLFTQRVGWPPGGCCSPAKAPLIGSSCARSGLLRRARQQQGMMGDLTV